MGPALSLRPTTRLSISSTGLMKGSFAVKEDLEGALFCPTGVLVPSSGTWTFIPDLRSVLRLGFLIMGLRGLVCCC